MADKASLILEASKQFIRGHEQVPKTQDFAPEAYYATKGDRAKGILTIGWGTTRLDDRAVQEGDTITREEAERYFERDVRAAISDFNSTVSKEARDQLGVNESAAVTSFLYNNGNTSEWRNSRALGHLNKLEIPEFIFELSDREQGFTKQRDPETGEYSFVKGLWKRRKDEVSLFNMPDIDANAGIGALSVNGYNDGDSAASGADIMRGFGISSLRDVKEMRKWLEAQAYGADLSAMDDDDIKDLIESLQGELADITEIEENRFYKDATKRDSDVYSDTYGETISREPYNYVMPDEWIEKHNERMGFSPFDVDPMTNLLKWVIGNKGHMPQSEYDAMVKKLTDLQSMQTGREKEYNRGGITNFRPMGAVPTGVGMPMHMPRPPRGQMPPPGMQGGGIVGYQNRGQVEGPLPPHLQMRPSWTPGEDEADIEEVLTDNPRIQFEALNANDDEEMRFDALVQELEHYRELASRSGHSIEEIISNRRAQGSLDPTAASNMLYMLETLRQQFNRGEMGGPLLSPPEPAPSSPKFESPEVQDIGYGGNKEEWARKRAEAAALYDRGFQEGGVVTPFGMSLADTAEMASFSSQAQAAPNGDLRGGIMSGQEAAGSGALGALSRQEFGTGRSLLPSFTTEERGMPGVEAQESWEVEPRYGRFYKSGGLTGQANKVAGAGRYGDTELVHMNPAEVQGLASLVPLTINPETGKPEAFLGMLLGVLGNYLAGTGMMAGVAGALGTSGIGSLLGSVITNPAIMGAIGSGGGTWAQTGDLEKGILSGMLSFGVGDALQKAGATSEGFLGSGATGKGLLSEATVTDPLTAATAASTATELPAIAARPGVGPFGFGARAGQAATSGLPANASPAVRDAVFKKVQEDTIKANQGIFNQQPLGKRLGHAGSNLLTKEGINAFMNPMNLSMISTGASGLGAIRAEEQYADWVEQQEEEKKRRRARMLGMPENIPQGVRQRFGLPAGGG